MKRYTVRITMEAKDIEELLDKLSHENIYSYIDQSIELIYDDGKK